MTTTFQINDVTFSKYEARDSHGTRVVNYWVGNHTLPYKDFCAALAATMDKVPGMQDVVCYALTHNNIGRHTELHKSMREVKELEAKVEA